MPNILIGISYILLTYFITKISENFPMFSGWKKTLTVNEPGSPRLNEGFIIPLLGTTLK